MSRRPFTVLAALLLAVMIAAPAIAQDEQYVSVQDPSFSWTGKEDQQANYSWSATIDNPTKRPAMVMVTLHLMDSNGDIVGSDSVTLEVERMSQSEISSGGVLAYAMASQAAQYRITIEGVES